jgi:predicted kinase
MNESGFLAMDLLAHRRADAAYLFLNRYLEVTGDYDGLRVLRFYLVYRALVRAKVRAIAAAQHQTTAPRRDGSGNERSERDSARCAGAALYLELAAHLVRPRTPLLAIAHGLSGSGKTQISGELIGRLPALRVRSDLERKRLGGIEAGTRSGSAVGAGLYDSELTQRTYERLHDVARHALRNGFDVIVDAAFLRAARRREFRVLANAERAHFVILDCVAPEAVLRDRIDSRCAAGRDASEADQKVLDYQLQTHERTSADEQSAVVELDTARSIDYDELAARLAAPR